MDRLAQLEEETKRRLMRLNEVIPDVKRITGDAEAAELSQSSQAAMARQQELKETIEKRKRARELAVPTNDNAVKLKLREFAEPICLFGETAPDRRERLRDVMAANLDLDTPGDDLRGGDTLMGRMGKRAAGALDGRQQEESKSRELFYTEGSEELREARRWLCEFSLHRAGARIAAERARIEQQCADQAAYEGAQRDLAVKLKGVQNQLSNFADERPVSFVGECHCYVGNHTVHVGRETPLVAIVRRWDSHSCEPPAAGWVEGAEL